MLHYNQVTSNKTWILWEKCYAFTDCFNIFSWTSKVNVSIRCINWILNLGNIGPTFNSGEIMVIFGVQITISYTRNITFGIQIFFRYSVTFSKWVRYTTQIVHLPMLGNRPNPWMAAVFKSPFHYLPKILVISSCSRSPRARKCSKISAAGRGAV